MRGLGRGWAGFRNRVFKKRGVIPAHAGIRLVFGRGAGGGEMDSRFRGNDAVDNSSVRLNVDWS
jgi:hypothetical protein